MSLDDFITINDRIEAGEPVSVEMMAEVFGPVVYDILHADTELETLEG